MSVNEVMRQLPSVDQLLQKLSVDYPRNLIAPEIRRVLSDARARIRAGEPVDFDSIEAQVRRRLQDGSRTSLRRVINATGVILHTNLGRAPLARPPLAQYGYSNLEYDLQSGQRGKRDVHASELLRKVTGANGIVVNNGAAALWLVLHEMAAGGEVIISRGELIEIGDGFRIPEIMERSGAILREIGTTNRTRIEDYERAVNDRTRMIVRVHASNFHISGFTAKPSLRELVEFSRRVNIPLYEDLGSGCLVDLSRYGVREPLVQESVASGADLVSFSGDKLLGGPQAGVIVGRDDLIHRIRRNPMFRALRVDKLAYGALESVLRCVSRGEWQQIPALGMIAMPLETIRDRALRVQMEAGGELVPGRSLIGGGSTPAQDIPTWLIAYEGEATGFEQALRLHDPPIIARIEDGRVLIDMRTVLVEQDEALAAALRTAKAEMTEQICPNM